MFIIKCLPIVGTAINGVEAVVALAEGDGKKCAAKLTQAGVGAAMDTAFVMSGGLSSLWTATLTGGTIEGGKIVTKKLVSNVVVRGATQFVTERAYEIDRGKQLSSASGGSTSPFGSSNYSV